MIVYCPFYFIIVHLVDVYHKKFGTVLPLTYFCSFMALYLYFVFVLCISTLNSLHFRLNFHLNVC